MIIICVSVSYRGESITSSPCICNITSKLTHLIFQPTELLPIHALRGNEAWHPLITERINPSKLKKKVFELINVSSDEEEAEPRGQNAGPRGDDVEPERFEATEMQQNVGQNVSHEEEGAWGGMPRLSYVPDFSNREDT